MSEPEVMLWSRLRGRNGERLTFRRQHAVGPIILDFYCPSARLAAEVDGRTHWDDNSRARDAARDRWLERRGIATLRVPAGEVYRDLASVTEAIFLRAGELLRAETLRLRPAPSTACSEPVLGPALGRTRGGRRSPSRHRSAMGEVERLGAPARGSQTPCVPIGAATPASDRSRRGDKG